MPNTQTLIELARSFPIREGVTHCEGCESHHWECLLRKLADSAEAWMLAAESCQREKVKMAQASDRDENLLLRAFNALNAESAVAELPPIYEEVVAELSERLEHRI